MIKSPKSYCFSDRPCRECRPLSCALLPTLRSIFWPPKRAATDVAFVVQHQPSIKTATGNVPAHALWQVNCGFRSDSVRYSLPWSLKCDHSCCNALCCQLRASHHYKLMQVASGLFFRIPSLRSECYNLNSNATLSSCVRPPCVHFDAKNTGGLVVWLAPVFSNIFCNEI